MTRLARIFLASTIVSVTAAVVLVFALFNEAERSSAYSQESYLTGFRDGGVYVVIRLERAIIERELIEEQKAHMAEERL